MTRGAPQAEAVGDWVPPLRARRHLAWVLALARWVKGWAERVLAEHAAALAKATVVLGGARVRSMPVHEPDVTLLPVAAPAPLWPPRLEVSSAAPPAPPVAPEALRRLSEPLDPDAPTPRLNTLRCVPMADGASPFDLDPEGGTPPRAPPGVPFGFDPDDLLPAEPGAVVALALDPAALLQAAALPLPDMTVRPAPSLHEAPAAAPRPLQAVPALPRGGPARELLALLRESEGTPTQPPVPWLEGPPPPPAGSTDAQEVLRQCERLELEKPGQ
ncbi:hypothetical protein OV208_00750 [Corallococcus sp. bb12-1]|uniref:hypothetical protein n=1 Tax=Corallococcus sp. bb12-1 TaxID=2996784 RepID=UPI00226E5312|nr:hypothetical protein [Corallococcus sp. bb12-1]MCY1039828.1 hypothetical protein [Corallococcus sp. bb12-1]